MNSTQPAEEKMASRNTRTHSNSSSKWLLFALPVSFFGLQTLLRSHPGKIKFDARNFQKSVENSKMLQKLSNFFRISRKKLPWTLPTFVINFHFYSLAFFSSRDLWRAEKSLRVFLNEKLVSRLKWNYRPSPTIFFHHFLWQRSRPKKVDAIEFAESRKKSENYSHFFLAHFPLGKESYCPSVRHSFYSSGGCRIWMIYGLIESLWSKDLKCDKKNILESILDVARRIWSLILYIP